MKNSNKIFWGLFLIFIGVIYGLSAFDIISINIFFNGWWTLFIIIPGILGLINGEEIGGNLIAILIGVSLLSVAQGFISIDKISRLIIPVTLVVIGLILLFKDQLNSVVSKKVKELNKKGEPVEYFATFSSQKVNIEGELKNLELSAIFGGIVCDLRKANIKDEVVINTTSIFGGIEVHAPDDAEVKVAHTSIFGGVDNKKESKDSNNKKIIYINSTCIFGGLEIK